MESNQEKVVHINKEIEEKQEVVEGAQEERTAAAETPAPAPAKAGKDMGKAALFISILTVLLLVVFFYALNRNVAGLADEVQELGQLRGQVATLDDKMVQFEDKLKILDTVPAIAKRTMLRSMVQDLSQRAAFISKEVEDENQSQQLQQAIELLDKVQQGFGD